MSQTSSRQATNGTGVNLMTPFGPPSPEIISNAMQSAMSANASVLEMNARLFHVAAAASNEWLDFIGRRMEKDAEFAEQLRRAENPRAMMSAYAQFFQSAAQNYQQEFVELTRLATKAANGVGDAIKDASAAASPKRSDEDSAPH